jgi:hypothetical protein
LLTLSPLHTGYTTGTEHKTTPYPSLLAYCKWNKAVGSNITLQKEESKEGREGGTEGGKIKLGDRGTRLR